MPWALIFFRFIYKLWWSSTSIFSSLNSSSSSNSTKSSIRRMHTISIVSIRPKTISFIRWLNTISYRVRVNTISSKRILTNIVNTILNTISSSSWLTKISCNNLLTSYYSPYWFYKPYGCIEWYTLWWRDIPDPTFYINICRGIDGYGSSGGGIDSSSSAKGPNIYQLSTCIYLITVEIDILNLYLTYRSTFLLPFVYIMGFHIMSMLMLFYL